MNESKFRDLFEKAMLQYLSLIDEQTIVECGKHFSNRYYDTPIEYISEDGLLWLIGYFPEIREDYLVMVMKFLTIDIFDYTLKEKTDKCRV